MQFFDILNIIDLPNVVIFHYYFVFNIFSFNSYTIIVILVANKCNTVAVTEDP